MDNARVTAAGAGRFEVLDSLRGVCAVFVVFYHFRNGNIISGLSFAKGSYLFVDFFFVLSGFVIAWNYSARLRDGRSLGTFLIRRFFRLVPLHLFILGLYLLAELLIRMRLPAELGMQVDSGRTMEDFIRTALLANSFGMDHQVYWNSPSWSISAEWWTYVVFGLLMLLPGAWNQRPLGLLLLSVLGITVLLFHHDGMGSAVADHGLFRCFYGFGLGALLAGRWPAVERAGAWLGPRLLGFAEILLLVLIVWFVGAAGNTPLSFVAPLLFLATVAVFAQEQGPMSRLLRRRFFLRAGVLSYSIYMLQQLVIGRVEDLSGALAGRADWLTGNPAVYPNLLMALVLLGVWFAAGLTHRFVELPGQAMGARLARAWQQRVGTA